MAGQGMGICVLVGIAGGTAGGAVAVLVPAILRGGSVSETGGTAAAQTYPAERKARPDP